MLDQHTVGNLLSEYPDILADYHEELRATFPAKVLNRTIQIQESEDA